MLYPGHTKTFGQDVFVNRDGRDCMGCLGKKGMCAPLDSFIQLLLPGTTPYTMTDSLLYIKNFIWDDPLTKQKEKFGVTTCSFLT